jgi:uncharacterized delta-60 repeat protein
MCASRRRAGPAATHPRPALADALERRRLLAAATFGAATLYGSGSSDGLTVADLNGDGHPDVISPDSAAPDSDGVSVFLNSGTGTFGAPVVYTTSNGTLSGLQPYAVATGDFNGDGHVDVASANYESGTLSVLFGNGDGTLGAPTVYTAGGTPNGIAVGDLNGDGHPDIAVVNRESDTVSVFLNQGNGTFAPAVNYAVGSGPNGVAIADLNGDGRMDIVTANLGGSLSVLLNAGGGTFAPAVPVSDTGSPIFVAVADLNGDGHPDLIVSNNSASTVDVFLGNGSGTTFAAPVSTTVGGSPVNLVVGDFNGDGLADVAVTQETSSSVGILQGNGDGTFQLDESFGAGLIAASIATGDLNGDGRLDLVVGAYNPGGTDAFATLFNTGTFTGTPTPTPTPTVTKTIGGLDPTFGTGGLAGHDVGFTATTGVAADGAQSVLVGPTGASPTESFGVTRYNADGSLDTTFGTAGVTTAAFAGADALPAAVSVLADGDILVAGTATTYGATGTAAGSAFAVAEFTAAGAPDASFGGGTGQALVSFSSTAATPSDDVLKAIAVGAGGVIYLGGSSDAAGKGNTDLAVAALTAAGALDTAFGTGGKALLDVAGGDDVANSLAVQTNGDVVAAGSATVDGVVEVALARFTAAGGLDPRFGTKGLVTDKVGGVYDEASSVAVQPKGQIVIGGLTASGSGTSLSSDFLVQRYTSAGRPDDSFGTRGTVTTSFGQPAAVTQVVLQSNGEVVASGKTTATLATVASGPPDVAIARYSTRGTLDASFNGTGKVVVDLGSGVVPTPADEVQIAAAAVDLGAAFDAFTSSLQGVVAVTAGGEILTAGNSGTDTVEAELVAAGIDLVAKLLSSLPAAVLGGAKGTATVTVTESGTTPATGSVTITVALATTASGTGATTAKAFPERVNLKQGQAHTYKLTFVYPAGLASGGYFVLTTVTDGTGLPADLNVANNTAASPAAVTVAPPTVKLAGSDLTAASAFAAGATAHVSIDLTDDGNVTAKGKIDVDLYLSADQTVADGTQVGTVPLAVGVVAGKSHAYRLTFKLPAAAASGSYTLLAVVDPARSLGADDQTDVTTVVVDASPVTVG